jgi:hypothetical protein
MLVPVSSADLEIGDTWNCSMHVSFEILNLLGFPKELDTYIGGPKPAAKIPG